MPNLSGGRRLFVARGAAVAEVVAGDGIAVDNTDPSGRNRHVRLTLTFGGIARARCAVVTVSGPSKAEALRRVREGDRSAPATGIDAEEVVWLVDPGALADSGPNGRSTHPR